MKQYTKEKEFCTEKNESWSVLEQIARDSISSYNIFVV